MNVYKHAGIDEAVVKLSRKENTILLTITDEGVGFKNQQAGGSGLGILMMRERVEAVGGKLIVQSTPGKGCQLDATIPVDGVRS